MVISIAAFLRQEERVGGIREVDGINYAVYHNYKTAAVSRIIQGKKSLCNAPAGIINFAGIHIYTIEGQAVGSNELSGTAKVH